MPQPPANTPTSLPSIIVVGLIVLVALGLRLTNLEATSLWIDEIYSLMVGNTHPYPQHLQTQIQSADEFYHRFLSWQPMDWNRLLSLLKINVHMPLYYLLLNPWLGWLGNDAWGLRSFSALCSSLLVIPIFLLGRCLGGQRAGYYCALVTALLPFQIYYGQEGRMYALTLFWTGWAGLGLWQVLYGKQPERWAWVYALSVLGGLLSHYAFVFFLGFQGLYSGYVLWKTRTWPRLVYLIPTLTALLGLALTWYPIYQLQQQGVDSDYHFAKGLLSWTRYLSVPFWQPLVVVAGDNRWSRILYIPLTLLLCGLAFRPGTSKPSQPEAPASLAYLFSWLWLPLLLQVAYDGWKHTHISIIDRYAMLVAPAMCLLLGLAITRLSRRVKPRYTTLLLTVMAAVALASVWTPSPFRDEHNKDDRIREKIAYFCAMARPGDLVFVNGPLGAPNLAAFYLRTQRPNQPMLYWISRYGGQSVPLPDSRVMSPYRRVWLFRHRANNERGLQTAKDYLQSLYPQVSRQQDWFIYSSR